MGTLEHATTGAMAEMVTNLETLRDDMAVIAVERETAAKEARDEVDRLNGAIRLLTGHKAMSRVRTAPKAKKVLTQPKPVIVGDTAREVVTSIVESEDREWAPSEIFITSAGKLGTSQAVSNVLPMLIRDDVVVKVSAGRYKATKFIDSDTAGVEAHANAGVMV